MTMFFFTNCNLNLSTFYNDNYFDGLIITMFYFCFITILYDYVLFTNCIFNLSTFYN
jgi:hypothetical protein